MPGQTAEDLLSLYDRAPLNLRYWVAFAVLSAITVLEFFDFTVVAYLIAVVGPRWHLTYGQSALILYSGGLGAIAGALVFGATSDAWGRKGQMIIGTFICGVGAALIGFVPDGAWQMFALLRFIVGLGLTAAVVPCLTMIVELTPTRHRTFVTSFYVAFATAGGLLSSITSAALLAAIGWRGMAMLGIFVAVVGVLAWLFVPESARWLTAMGRFADARANIAKQLGVKLQSLPLPTVRPVAVPRARLSELLQHPRQFCETLLIWGGAATAAYGVYMWGPTVISLLLKIPVPQAAKYFIWVAGAGVTGKVVASLLAPVLGRRLLGVLWGFGGVAALATVGYSGSTLIGGVPLIVVLLCASTFCIDGSFSNLGPYTVESYGVRLGARSSGLGQTANGAGKILGPLSLALIAGTSNIVSPKATEGALIPAFLFLAFGMLLVALSFTVLARETHGRPMALDEQQPAARRRVVLGAETR